MYCKRCGCKIQAGEKTCPDCGNVVGHLEYCGGFWGLTGKTEPEETKEKNNPADGTKNEHSTYKVQERVGTDKKGQVANIENVTNSKIIRSEKDMQQTPLRKNGRRRSKAIYKALMVAVICLLGLSVVQSLRVKYKETEYKRKASEYQKLTTSYEELQKKYTDAESRIRELEEVAAEAEESVAIDNSEVSEAFDMENSEKENTEVADEEEDTSDTTETMRGENRHDRENDVLSPDVLEESEISGIMPWE